VSPRPTHRGCRLRYACSTDLTRHAPRYNHTRRYVLVSFSSGPYRPGSGGALDKFLDSDSQVHPEKMTASVNPALYN